MKTKFSIARTTCPKAMAGRLRTACAKTLLPLLLFLLVMLPAVVQAQFNYTDNGDGTITITGYYGPGGAETIPSTIDGMPVTSIGDGAFYGCTGLTGVTIPDSVTSIGDWAFFACTSLTEITVDALNSVYSSLDGVLFDKSQTTLIGYPEGKAGSYAIPNSVTSIGYMAFDGCTSLTSVTITHSVTTIGDWAFLSCTSLTSVTIGSSATTIGVGAFCGCTSLISMTIPDSVSSIGDGAFEFCSSLTSVTIGNGVTSIGTYAFLSCTSLTNVTVGKSVTSIGNWAFEACYSLVGVYFKGNAPSLGSAVFNGDNNATVYYLPGTTGWGTTFGGLPAVLWNLPVADVSATAAWLVSANGTNATAVLNGSRSYDPNGDALQYL